MSDLSNFPVPLLGFAAFSGTGKTTLLERLIPCLTRRGVNIAVVKHSHHDIEIDTPGKDSYRLRKAGVSQLLLAGPSSSILFNEYLLKQDKKLIEQLSLLSLKGLDLVLVEGYRDEAFDKIELHRPELNKPLLFKTDRSIIAVACDQKIATGCLPLLDLNNIEKITHFIISQVKIKK